MFSARLDAGAVQNELAILLDKKRKLGVAICDLICSNPTKCDFDFYSSIDRREFSSSDILRYDPQPFSHVNLRKKVAGLIGVEDESGIVAASSTSELYSWILKLLCDPGDDILVPAPGYPLFGQLASLDSVDCHSYSLIYENDKWSLDIKRIRHSIGNRTKAICVVSPNNPTGSYLTEPELTELSSICNEFNLALIVDEVFFDYRLALGDKNPITASSNKECLTFVLNGLSKMLCLPQVKLGWMNVSGPDEKRSEALRRLEFIADAYLPVSALIVSAFSSLIDKREIIQREVLERINKNWHILKEFSDRHGWRMLDSEGGWYACVRVGKDSWRFAIDLLDRCDTYIHPGCFYDFREDDVLVFSLIVQTNLLTEGLGRISA